MRDWRLGFFYGVLLQFVSGIAFGMRTFCGVSPTWPRAQWLDLSIGGLIGAIGWQTAIVANILISYAPFLDTHPHLVGFEFCIMVLSFVSGLRFTVLVRRMLEPSHRRQFEASRRAGPTAEDAAQLKLAQRLELARCREAAADAAAATVAASV